LKEATTYEIIDPREIGADISKIILTARSGRSALAFRFKKLGFDFTRDEVDTLYSNFLRIADLKKEVHDEDLQHMAKALL
jgi:2-isopropylmalate synthase